MPDLKEKNRIILKNSKMHELWDLGAPTILEQALQTIVAYVDTAMVGQIGAIASAAVGLTTTVNWLLNGILFAVSMEMCIRDRYRFMFCCRNSHLPIRALAKICLLYTSMDF